MNDNPHIKVSSFALKENLTPFELLDKHVQEKRIALLKADFLKEPNQKLKEL